LRVDDLGDVFSRHRLRSSLETPHTPISRSASESRFLSRACRSSGSHRRGGAYILFCSDALWAGGDQSAIRGQTATLRVVAHRPDDAVSERFRSGARNDGS
jgi:hypothetical protein